MTIDESRPVYGGKFAVNRYERYQGTVDWKEHCVYFKVKIYRAYHKDSGKPCALYAAFPADDIMPKWHMDCNLVAESLDTIKTLVKQVVG